MLSETTDLTNYKLFLLSPCQSQYLEFLRTMKWILFEFSASSTFNIRNIDSDYIFPTTRCFQYKVYFLYPRKVFLNKSLLLVWYLYFRDDVLLPAVTPLEMSVATLTLTTHNSQILRFYAPDWWLVTTGSYWLWWLQAKSRTPLSRCICHC